MNLPYHIETTFSFFSWINMG